MYLSYLSYVCATPNSTYLVKSTAIIRDFERFATDGVPIIINTVICKIVIKNGMLNECELSDDII